MNVAVWDTYVARSDGKTMHFDILAPNHITTKETIISYGREYLKTKHFKTTSLTSEECRLCHMEEATQEIAKSINSKGYFILEMENCT